MNKEHVINILKDVTFELIDISNIAKDTLEKKDNLSEEDILQELKFIKIIIKNIQTKLHNI